MVKNNSELQKQNSEYQKQNHEFQKQMLEVCKKGNNINTNNSYNNNKTFNLQFFLKIEHHLGQILSSKIRQNMTPPRGVWHVTPRRADLPGSWTKGSNFF